MQATCDVFHKRSETSARPKRMTDSKERFGVAVSSDWEKQVCGHFPPGKSVHARISSISERFVTVQLAPNIEGLLHRSEVAAPDQLRLGQWIDVVVVSVDATRHLIALAMKR
jgi:ribosomal protein S1